MKLNAYVEWTDTVAKYPQTAESYYLALGLSDEFGEMMEMIYNSAGLEPQEVISGFVKEAGDVLWYLSRYGRNVLKLDVEQTTLHLAQDCRLNPDSEDANYQIQQGANMAIHIGALCGFEKKKLRDADTWSVEKKIEKQLNANESWKKVMIGFLYALAYFETSIDEVIEVNQGKLNKRLEDNTIKGDGSNR